jgi:hypothetical protein
MTTPPAPPPPSLRRPTRRRLTDTLPAAIAPVVAFGLALGGLTTWVTAGRAGSPPRIAVSKGRVFRGVPPAGVWRAVNAGCH